VRLAPLPTAPIVPEADRPQTGAVPQLVYQDAAGTLLRGDCARLMEVPERAEVDLVVTSPPYALGVDYGQAGYADDQPYERYLEWVAVWADALLQASAYGGRACINIPLDSNKGGKRAIYADYLRIFQAAGWTYQTSIVWNEQNISRRTAWGSWLLPSAPHVVNPTEMIVIAHAGAYRRPAAGRRGDILPAEQRDWSLAMWSFAGANARLVGHPAPFPEELPRRLIKLYSYPDDVVADPFLGSGTTAIVAARLGRRVLGVDRSPTYVSMARQRLMTALERPAAA